MIVVDALSKSFKRKGRRVKGESARVQAIEKVSFTAADGNITGLLGSNGAGKSTTLRILSTLMQPDSGNASIDGFDILSDPLKARESIGFMPHNAGIYPRLSARENISYYANICGVEAKAAAKRIEQLVGMLDMAGFIDRRAEGFSQGQKTKVGLARALVHSPQTLILDEPTNGLDVMATRGLREIIRQVADEGHCVLFSSHIMQEVEALCDHISIIADGRIAISGTHDAILQKTQQSNLEDAFVAAVNPENAPATNMAPDTVLDDEHDATVHIDADSLREQKKQGGV